MFKVIQIRSIQINTSRSTIQIPTKNLALRLMFQITPITTQTPKLTSSI